MLFLKAFTDNGKKPISSLIRLKAKEALGMKRSTFDKNIKTLIDMKMIAVQQCFRIKKKDGSYKTEWEGLLNDPFYDSLTNQESYHVFAIDLKCEDLKSLMYLSLIKDQEDHPRTLHTKNINQKMLAEVTFQSIRTIKSKYKNLKERSLLIEKSGSKTIQLNRYKAFQKGAKTSSTVDYQANYINKNQLSLFKDANWYETKKLKIKGVSVLAHHKNLFLKKQEFKIEVQSLMDAQILVFPSKEESKYNNKKLREQRRLGSFFETNRFKQSLSPSEFEKWNTLQKYRKHCLRLKLQKVKDKDFKNFVF